MNTTAIRVLGCNGPPFNGKVFVIDQGRRRWLQDAKLLQHYGLVWPEDVEWVTAQTIKKYPLGASLPSSTPNKHTMQGQRELLCRHVRGNGLEFGAAANPMPVPLGVTIRYVDLFSTPVLEQELYDATQQYECVDIDVQSSFDTMKGIDDEAYDFIIASHVIEHVRDPIGAIHTAFQKLRSGGKLVLIVPKKERTLDKVREVTSLQHAIEDFQNPDRYRDVLHVLDFYTNAYSLPLDVKQLYQYALSSVNSDEHSIHYHVWNEKAFKELIAYAIKLDGWILSQFTPCLKGEDNYEFYVELTKR